MGALGERPLKEFRSTWKVGLVLLYGCMVVEVRIYRFNQVLLAKQCWPESSWERSVVS